MVTSKRTKALAIPHSVKDVVSIRDHGKCILCGRPGSPNAHFIARHDGGLGIEQNILTLCIDCHFRYDHSLDRAGLHKFFKRYLESKYPDFDEGILFYRKGM